MALNVKSFARLVQDQAATIQTKSSKLVAFAVGSLLRAVIEANASVALWLQGLVIYVLSLTRLSTSTGTDVDSWVNDWGISRLAATLASGQVTYSRFTPTNSAVVPVGAQVQTADGSQTFAVVADPSHSSWSADQNGYLLPAEVASITVPVQSVTGSTAANVIAGAINVMYTAITGVDYVSNALPFAGGANAESDASLKARFVAYIASLSKGTIPAIKYAVSSLQLGLECTIIENVTPDGVATPGFLWVTVDDGSGAPPQSTLDEAALAVGNTRAGGIMWGVFPPIVLPADIAIRLDTATGYDHQVVVATVADAVTKFVNTLPLGADLQFLRLAQVVQNASAGVSGLSIIVNGTSLDITAEPQNVVKISTLTVT